MNVSRSMVGELVDEDSGFFFEDSSGYWMLFSRTFMCTVIVNLKTQNTTHSYCEQDSKEQTILTSFWLLSSSSIFPVSSTVSVLLIVPPSVPSSTFPDWLVSKSPLYNTKRRKVLYTYLTPLSHFNFNDSSYRRAQTTVVASYSGLYEECDVEHINVFGPVS